MGTKPYHLASSISLSTSIGSKKEIDKSWCKIKGKRELNSGAKTRILFNFNITFEINIKKVMLIFPEITYSLLYITLIAEIWDMLLIMLMMLGLILLSNIHFACH